MIPRLIHPVKVTIERLQRNVLVMDQDAREPVLGPRTTAAATVEIQAQCKWTEAAAASAEEAGVVENYAGYILVRYKDMEAKLGAGVRFKRGDRITRMGQLADLDLYIVREEPMGHKPMGGNATATLVRYWFEDRKPVRQSGDL